MDIEYLIDHLKLIPHPEGGYYSETYRSDLKTHTPYDTERHVCTAIYYLLEAHDKSRFHRLRSDELWFYHQGQSLEILLIENGVLEKVLLGAHLQQGEVPQFRIPANTWFAAHVHAADGHCLVSCVVSPGFDFADFELAERAALVQEYPHLEKVIHEFTKRKE